MPGIQVKAHSPPLEEARTEFFGPWSYSPRFPAPRAYHNVSPGNAVARWCGHDFTWPRRIPGINQPPAQYKLEGWRNQAKAGGFGRPFCRTWMRPTTWRD